MGESAVALSVLHAAASGVAAQAQAVEYDGLSTLWVLLAAVLVFFMQAGFGMVEAGLIRSKNAANVLMKNLMDFCFAALGFFIFGYAIAYGTEGLLVGTSGWFMFGAESPIEGLPTEVFWLFQAVFAGTAATIVSGAMAERMRFVAYLTYSFLLTAFIYPVVAHWVWGGAGWQTSTSMISPDRRLCTGWAAYPRWWERGSWGRASGVSTKMDHPTP